MDYWSELLNTKDSAPRESPGITRTSWWVGGWLAPILVILFTLIWSLMIYWLIGWRTRDWQYGTVPYVPAESTFTTQDHSAGRVPKQVELPSRPTGGRNVAR